MAEPSPSRRLRRTLVTLAAATSLLPATACGGVGLADDSDTFTTMGFGLGDALASVRVEEATKAVGDLEVKVNEGAFDEQQFLSSVAAGEPPDVVAMDRTLIGGYAARGAVLPLTSCLKERHVDLGVYRKGAIDEVTLDGAVYALPDSYDNRILLINGAGVKKAGYRVSDVDTSDWEGLRAFTRKLTRTKDGKPTRIGFDPKIPEFFPLWVRANGGSLLSEDGRTARLNSPEVVEALEYTVSLIDAQGGWGRVKALRDSFDIFGEANPFAADQVGAFPMEDWYVNVLAGASPKIDLGTDAFKSRDGRPINYVSGNSWAIPKGSKHPEEACAFVTTMTSADSWVKAARAKAKEVRDTGSPYVADFTGNRVADRVIKNEIWKPSGNAAFDKATNDLYAMQRYGFSVPANAAGTEFRKAWQNAVNRVLSGVQSPQRALDEAQEKAQSVLDLAAQEREE